jgi:hypothetical protein
MGCIVEAIYKGQPGERWIRNKASVSIYLFRRIMDADFGEYWSEVCSLIVLAQWKSQASLSGRFR